MTGSASPKLPVLYKNCSNLLDTLNFLFEFVLHFLRYRWNKLTHVDTLVQLDMLYNRPFLLSYHFMVSITLQFLCNYSKMIIREVFKWSQKLVATAVSLSLSFYNPCLGRKLSFRYNGCACYIRNVPQNSTSTIGFSTLSPLIYLTKNPSRNE